MREVGAQSRYDMSYVQVASHTFEYIHLMYYSIPCRKAQKRDDCHTEASKENIKKKGDLRFSKDCGGI
jgi:hypothetical protein